ncbi:MAG TPA: hypothetical protein VMZ25_09895, partial [Terriglobales bacterium]|nr:hypothetical protein [Terriglobales bacterium]
MPKILYLECSKCGHQLSAEQPQNLCPQDAGSLYVRYDLKAIKGVKKEAVATKTASMWRYADVLPDVQPVTLGEGF